MPQIAEDTSASLPADNTDPADAIASLLIGDELEEVEAEEVVDEQPEEATDEAEDSEEEETPSEESTEESEGEVEESWESVLGVDEDKLEFDDKGNVSGVKVKINGEQSTVKMDELITGYQSNKAYTQKSQALADERKAFEAKASEVQKDYKAKLDNVDIVTKYLSDKLVSDYESIDWPLLREQNPAEYAALKQDYSAKAIELQRAQEAMKEERDVVKQREVEEQRVSYQNHIVGQMEIMIRNNPTWEDPNKRDEDMTTLKKSLSTHYGYNPQDFDNVTDARLIEVVKDAVAYREGSKIAEKKKVKRPVPKFQKSVGRGVKKKVSKLDKLTRAARSAKGADKRQLQTDAVSQLLLGG